MTFHLPDDMSNYFHDLTTEVDSKEIQVPPVEGLIILNILRYVIECIHILASLDPSGSAKLFYSV